MFRYAYATQRLSRHIFCHKLKLKYGDKAVQLKAAEEAYAQFVKVGTEVTDITQTATIKAAVNADETKIVLTITPPTGDAGFIKFTTAK